MPLVILEGLQDWGRFGVDLFFVISGFVMAYAQLARPKRAGVFLKLRLIRIVPIYWLLTVFSMGLVVVIPSFFQIFPAFYLGIPPEWPVFVHSLFFVSRLLDDTYPILYVGWTMEFEMFFYLVFAIGLLSKNSLRQIAFPIISIPVLVSIGGAHMYMLEFIYGMLAGVIAFRIDKMRFSRLIAGFGFIWLFSDFTVASEISDLVRWGVPAFLIVLGANYAPQINNVVLLRLGEASYSIYLIQVFALPMFYVFAETYLCWVLPDALALLAVAFTAMAGVLVYTGIEKPITGYLRTA